MVIKHGRHILGEIHEVRKGLWALFLDCTFPDADWLSRQTRGSVDKIKFPKLIRTLP